MSKDLEIELKFPLTNAKSAAEYLDLEAQFVREVFQYDVYFVPVHRNFIADIENVCEWLRVRVESDGTASFNYKNWLPHDEKVKTHCTEYETYVSSFDQLQKILLALNFNQLVEVKKTRKTWRLGEAEVSIDLVQNLGEFVELEYKGDGLDVDGARSYLLAILSRIGAEVTSADLKGYPFLLLERNGISSAPEQ